MAEAYSEIAVTIRVYKKKMVKLTIFFSLCSEVVIEQVFFRNSQAVKQVLYRS